MLDRLRARLDTALTKVGRGYARVVPNPTAWTLVGFLLSIAASYSYSSALFAGEFLGGALLLVSGWFDIVDGAVAKVTGRVSRRGSFLDSTLDRVAEVALFTGILLGGYASPTLVLIGLSLSLLVSYTRAKGDALGVRLAGVGIGERSERLIALAVSSLLGLAGWGVVLVIMIAGFTFAERFAAAFRELEPPAQGPQGIKED